MPTSKESNEETPLPRPEAVDFDLNDSNKLDEHADQDGAGGAHTASTDEPEGIFSLFDQSFPSESEKTPLKPEESREFDEEFSNSFDSMFTNVKGKDTTPLFEKGEPVSRDSHVTGRQTVPKEGSEPVSKSSPTAVEKPKHSEAVALTTERVLEPALEEESLPKFEEVEGTKTEDSTKLESNSKLESNDSEEPPEDTFATIVAETHDLDFDDEDMLEYPAEVLKNEAANGDLTDFMDEELYDSDDSFRQEQPSINLDPVEVDDLLDHEDEGEPTDEDDAKDFEEFTRIALGLEPDDEEEDSEDDEEHGDFTIDVADADSDDELAIANEEPFGYSTAINDNSLELSDFDDTPQSPENDPFHNGTEETIEPVIEAANGLESSLEEGSTVKSSRKGDKETREDLKNHHKEATSRLVDNSSTTATQRIDETESDFSANSEEELYGELDPFSEEAFLLAEKEEKEAQKEAEAKDREAEKNETDEEGADSKDKDKPKSKDSSAPSKKKPRNFALFKKLFTLLLFPWRIYSGLSNFVFKSLDSVLGVLGGLPLIGLPFNIVRNLLKVIPPKLKALATLAILGGLLWGGSTLALSLVPKAKAELQLPDSGAVTASGLMFEDNTIKGNLENVGEVDAKVFLRTELYTRELGKPQSWFSPKAAGSCKSELLTVAMGDTLELSLPCNVEASGLVTLKAELLD